MKQCSRERNHDESLSELVVDSDAVELHVFERRGKCFGTVSSQLDVTLYGGWLCRNPNSKDCLDRRHYR